MNVWHDAWVKKYGALLVCIVLAIAILAVYGQVRDHAFINLDDDHYITENPHIQAGITLENLKWAFTTLYAGNWHPLTWLSHMLDVQLFGLKAGWHHLINVFFHIANTLLLFLILRRMTKTFWRSAFVAALFALHPLHVESVAWAAERKDVLSTLFWMLTLGAYTYYRECPGYRRYLWVLVCFILGLLSKPMLVTLPFVLLLLDFWPLGRLQPAKHAGPDSRNAARPEEPARKKRKAANIATVKAADREEWPVYPLRWTVIRPLLLEKAPLLALAALSSIVTIISQQKDAMVSLQALPLDARIANALVSYLKYIGKMLWPLDLAVLYPLPDEQPVWLVLGATLALAAATFLVLRKTRRFPYLGVGWFWYLGTLVPVIGLLQVGSQELADRYSYVPMVGLLMIVAWGIPDSLQKWGRRKAVLGALAGIVVLACAVLTWAQVQLWRDSITLFSHTLKVTTDNDIIQNNMGTALSNQGKFEAAIVHYRSAIRIKPRYVDAWNNLGLAYEQSGRSAEAIDAYREALHLQPNDTEVWNNLGNAYGKSGQTAKAIETLREALRINPVYDKAWSNLGKAYGDSGETAKAIESLQQALRINPKSAKAWDNLGVVYVESGRTSEAIETFQRSLHIKPEQADVWHNLAFTYRQHGETAQAIEAYREALRINPRYAKAWFGLGIASAESGRTNEVGEIYRTLKTLDPAAAEEFSKRVPLLGK